MTRFPSAFADKPFVCRHLLGHYGHMTGVNAEHEHLLSARLLADDRFVMAKPLAGSAVGEATGLAAVATRESDVLEASCSLPGRVLVLAESAISRRTVPVLVQGARLATFSSLVFLGHELGDLLQLGGTTVPVPAVLVARKADHYWITKATRLTVTVSACDEQDFELQTDRVIDVRAERRRRAVQPDTVAATPGVVRR